MAIVINGSGTVTGISVGGLPDGIVDAGTVAADVATQAEIDAKLALAGGTMTGALIATESGNNAEIKVGAETSKDFQGYAGVQFDDRGFIGGYPNDSLGIFYNTYHSSGSKAIDTAAACNIQLLNTGIRFQTAASASADAAQTMADQLMINTNGNLVMGNSATSQKIEFRCEYTNPQIQIQGTTTTNTNKMTFNNSNGQVGSISCDGSATAFNTSSDYRLKENIDYTWDATTRLKQLKPARFNFIADADKTVDGFIAHEVSSIVPEAISGEKDAMTDVVLYVEGDELPEGKSIGDVKEASVIDPQGIDQSKLVPLLVKTIQELEARITALEA